MKIKMAKKRVKNLRPNMVLANGCRVKSISNIRTKEHPEGIRYILWHFDSSTNLFAGSFCANENDFVWVCCEDYYAEYKQK